MGQRTNILLLFATIAIAVPLVPTSARRLQQVPGSPSNSLLWGTNGELYKPAGRLLDYSYAGYRAGEGGITARTPTNNVKDYGAKGDGVTDDSNAFLAALSATPNKGVLYIPPGTFVLQQRLYITRRINIKGAGTTYTTLLFPKSLTGIYGDPNAPLAPGEATYYSFNGGFIVYNGSLLHNPEKGKKAVVTENASKGSNTIKVDSTSIFVAGEWVSITQGSPDDNNWNPVNLNTGIGCTDTAFCTSDVAYTFQSRVAQVLDGKTLLLERPLNFNLYSTFQPKYVWKWAPGISNIGVEGINFVFKSPQYQGHFTEPGYNGINFVNVANSFIRDCRFQDADVSVRVFNSAFVTVSNVTMSATAGRPYPKSNVTGHHGVFVGNSSEILVTKFDIQTKYVHDLTVDEFTTGTVFSNGKGIDLTMDHHRSQNYGTLWTNLDCNASTRAWQSGGSSNRGYHAGLYTTYWNLRAKPNNLPGLSADFGPGLNFVGMPSKMTYPNLTTTVSSTWYIEPIKNSDLLPKDLYVAMYNLRKSTNWVSPKLGGVGTKGKDLNNY